MIHKKNNTLDILLYGQAYQFNTRKYNDPMFTGKQMATLIICCFCLIIYIICFRDLVPIVNPHQAFIFQVIIIEPTIMKIAIPMTYLKCKKEFRKWLLQYMDRVISHFRYHYVEKWNQFT